MDEVKSTFWNGLTVKAILIGSLCGALAILLLTFLFSFLLLSVHVSDTVIDIMILFAVAIGGLTAGYLCGRALREKGLLLGAISGGILFLLLLIVGVCIGEAVSGMMTAWKLLVLLLGSSIGGILGANARNRSPKLTPPHRRAG